MTKARNPLQTRASALADSPAILGVVAAAIQLAAAPVAEGLNMPNMIPVNEASLGDFPWSWQSGTQFNAKTFTWLNSLFSYNPNTGYATTTGAALTTSLYNVMQDIHYVLDAADNSAVNTAILQNNAVVNTMISTWASTMGPIPPSFASQEQQAQYITTQVMAWGAPQLTLGQLRNSTNPHALLPNVPMGADSVVNALLTYLAATSSISTIQAAVLSNNNQLNQVVANINPQPPLTALAPGFMQTIDDKGNSAFQVEIDIAESTAVIQNNLLPASGTGASFSTTYTALKQSNDTVQISANGSAGTGVLGWFLSFNGGGSASYDMFSADGSLTSCTCTLDYNGVTTVTPSFSPYNITTGAGWWDPEPIREAANPPADQSGFSFMPAPDYSFGVKGNFGAIARLMISQQPTITLTYVTSNYAAFQQIFQENSSWDISFLGIDIASGQQSYYQANTSYDSNSTTVTVTMTPVGIKTPVTPMDQLANVVGAQLVWPGASNLQNRAGI